MAQILRGDDPRLAWRGAVSLQRTEQYVMPWRIPYKEQELFDPGLVERASWPAGVRLAFRSDTTELSGSIELQPENSPLDICCNGKVVASIPLDGKDRFRCGGLPKGKKLFELWLPQVGQFRLQSLELPAGAVIETFEETGPKWITYGSSITHCGGAASPTQTWPAIVARARGLNLTCLGFGGQCHLDTMIAMLIRDLPADVISMCVGINIQGGSSLGPRAFSTGIIGFVKIIREKHPDIPIVVMSPILSPPRETTPNAVGFTLVMMRDEVQNAVAALRDLGDRNLHYVNGLDVFGPEWLPLLPDELHPDAEGYRQMGRNFLSKVVPTHFP